MTSFQLAYDAGDDVLTVAFGEQQDVPSQHVVLNDHIEMWFDPERRAVNALVFRAYSRLLGVSETDFAWLREADAETQADVLALLAGPPASAFFDLTDPEGLIARVLSPSVEELYLEDQA